MPWTQWVDRHAAVSKSAAAETPVGDDAPSLTITRAELGRAMQQNQDRSYLDEANHRYHCGGSSCADRVWDILADRLAPR